MYSIENFACHTLIAFVCLNSLYITIPLKFVMVPVSPIENNCFANMVQANHIRQLCTIKRLISLIY